MKSNKSLEDYLECILLLSRENEFVHRVDVARKIGVSQPAVQKAVKILQSENYIDCDGLHIYLTPQGSPSQGSRINIRIQTASGQPATSSPLNTKDKFVILLSVCLHSPWSVGPGSPSLLS